MRSPFTPRPRKNPTPEPEPEVRITTPSQARMNAKCIGCNRIIGENEKFLFLPVIYIDRTDLCLLCLKEALAPHKDLFGALLE